MNLNLSQFSGVAPVFPLPNVVQFPQTMLPLHIFEQRYRQMLKAALEGEKLIAMALLSPGWEENYSGNPEIYPTVCLGAIVKHEPLDDGRSNIMLLGLQRAMVSEIVSPRPFRLARLELLEDQMGSLNEAEENAVKTQLLELYGEFVVQHADSGIHYPSLSSVDFSLNALTDAISAVVGLPSEQQVQLLAETNVETRSAVLIQRLQEMTRQTHSKAPAVHLPYQSHPKHNRIHLN